MLAYIPASAFGGSSGGSSGSSFPVGVGIGRPEEIGLCDTDAWGNITDPVVRQAFQTPRVMEALRELAADSLSSSTEQLGRIIIDTRPSGAFSLRFQAGSEFANNINATCRNISFHTSSDMDLSNSIAVHTHLACGGLAPETTPSDADRAWLGGLGFQSGIIIDLGNDLIIHYKPGDDEGDSGDQQELCGFSE